MILGIKKKGLIETDCQSLYFVYQNMLIEKALHFRESDSKRIYPGHSRWNRRYPNTSEKLSTFSALQHGYIRTGSFLFPEILYR